MKKETGKLPLRERLRRGLKDMPVFWHHFIPMGVILILSVTVQVVSFTRYTRLAAENYISQVEDNFHQNIDAMSSLVYDFYTGTDVLEATTDYADLRRITKGEIPAAAMGLILRDLQSSFNNTIALAGVPEGTDYFLYYPEAEAIFTKSEVFVSAQDCFERHILLDGKSAADALQTLRELGASLQVCPAQLEDGEKCLAILMRPLGGAGVIGAVLPAGTLKEFFDLSGLPETAYLHFLDNENRTLFSVGEPTEDCYELTAAVRGIRCSAVIGIPRDYFRQQAAPTRNSSLLLLGLSLALGIALSVAFSNVGARPLRQLLSSYSLEDRPSEARNEIFRLADLLASSRQAEQAVTQILSVQVLGRVLSGGVLAQEEEESLLEAYPALSGNCRIAIVHTTDETEEFGQNAVTELLQEHLPEHFACLTLSNLESGVLFSDDADALHDLAQVLSGVNHQLGMDGITVQCGVSAPFTGVHSAYAAVRQARFSIPIRESSYIEVYSAREDGDDRPGVFSWLTHERLYQAVMKNDRTDTVQFIRALGADKYYSAAEAKEVFYNVRFVVRSTAGEMRLPLPEADALEYREEMRPKDNFRKLEELTGLLFERLGARQAMNDADALDNVVRYIAENFHNPDLSAASVSTHFSLPVKTVYAAVRERMDLNFNEFLISVRMKEAARLLCTTNRSVDEIGEECGYPAQSTFYRVFKKYYGESPNRYRSLHLREE